MRYKALFKLPAPCRTCATAKTANATLATNFNFTRLSRPTIIRKSWDSFYFKLTPPVHRNLSQTTIKTPPSTKNPRRFLLHGTLLSASLLGLYLFIFSTNPQSTELNQTNFTPYPIVSLDPIPSSTAFLLTLAIPPTSSSSSTQLSTAWQHGLWSLEIKQPQLQIARHYTPLPNSSPTNNNNTLQFFIRQYDGGELSTYLSRLHTTATVELRGPHLGFDLATRLGSHNHNNSIVFLAGGTGIAPALQAAAWMLDHGSSSGQVRILWANRNAADCKGCVRVSRASSSSSWWWGKKTQQRYEEEQPSLVVQQIRALQAAYERKGRVLDVKCVVDGEAGTRGRITARDIRDAVVATTAAGATSSAGVSVSGDSCYFHAQKMLETSTEQDDVVVRTERPCTCSTPGEGKNLLLVSGPEGFVSAFTGPKVWADGAERQGPLGGVVAGLASKEPELWRNWLVLKQ